MSDYAQQINIKTLSPIHIGNGVFLQNGSDFVSAKDGKYNYIYIIDPRKILSIIGVEHLYDWVASIERHTQDTLKFVKRYRPNTQPIDFAKRQILSYSAAGPTDTLKECLHDGKGIAYIPGSSIKGAIRTAILSTLVSKIANVESRVTSRGKVSAKQVEGVLFGTEPNSSLFRFLHVGDAYFSKDCEISTRMINLNIRNNQEDLRDIRMSQLVEAIGTECESNFRLKLSREFYQWAKVRYNHRDSRLKELPDCMKSIPALFETLNAHTIKLLKEEIGIWEKVSAQHTGAEDYIENMKDLLDSACQCRKGEECVLRLGHGSGWRFVTGAWSEQLNNFGSIVNSARPYNEKRYRNYIFPKSRRLDKDSDVLGFIKLSYT